MKALTWPDSFGPHTQEYWTVKNFPAIVFYMWHRMRDIINLAPRAPFLYDEREFKIGTIIRIKMPDYYRVSNPIGRVFTDAELPPRSAEVVDRPIREAEDDGA